MKMNPGDRVRGVRTHRHGFVLYTSNISDERVLVRFDGDDFNTTAYAENLEVLPSEPFRPLPSRTTVTVKYHISRWPYDDSVIDRRNTVLHIGSARWMPPTDGFVDEIAITQLPG